MVALRSMATEVVDAELARLLARLPDLDEASRAEVLRSLRRVADKLLHQPTVRVKELANETGAVSYAAALAELFALDPDAVEAVTRPEGLVPTRSVPSGSAGDPEDRPMIRIGTRASLLATTQVAPVADLVRDRLGRDVELVEVTTEGDRSRGAAGGPRRHRRVRDARCARRCSTAASTSPCTPSRTCPPHPPPGIVLAAVPPREDPRDVVVARDGLTLGELPVGSRVGTGSPRRAAQLHALGLGLEIVDIRGNVDTRARQGRVRRVRRRGARPRRPGPARPARRGHRGARPAPDAAGAWPGGARGRVPGRRRRSSPRSRPLDDPATRAASTAERAVLATLEGGCSAPIGALAEVAEGDDGDELWVRAVALSPDGALVGPRCPPRGPPKTPPIWAHGSHATCSPREPRT